MRFRSRMLPPLQPATPTSGYLWSVTLVDALGAKGVGDTVLSSVAKGLLCPPGRPPVGYNPCVLHEGTVLKLLRDAGLKVTVAVAVKKALGLQDAAVSSDNYRFCISSLQV